MDKSIFIKILGVRGSFPMCDDKYSIFGGNTSCVFIKAGEQIIILDAGSGIINASKLISDNFNRFSLLISHSHIDHILGIPFLPNLYCEDCECNFYLKTRDNINAKQQIEKLMSPPLWPITTSEFKAKVKFFNVEDVFFIGDVKITTMESYHPGGCTLYKIDYGGKAIVYASDFEADEENICVFSQFARNCDLLFIDSQYTEQEYKTAKGFGHSTMQTSAKISKMCRAKQTRFIHHNPFHTDSQLLEFEKKIIIDYPNIRFARSGEELVFK